MFQTLFVSLFVNQVAGNPRCSHPPMEVISNSGDLRESLNEWRFILRGKQKDHNKDTLKATPQCNHVLFPLLSHRFPGNFPETPESLLQLPSATPIP